MKVDILDKNIEHLAVYKILWEIINKKSFENI